PIANAVASSVKQATRRMGVAKWSPAVRMGAGAGAVLFGMFTLGLWMPLALAAGSFYIIYRVMAALANWVSGSPQSAEPAYAAAAQAAPVAAWQSPPAARDPSPESGKRPWRRRTTPQWQQIVQEHLASRGLRERSTEALSAMLTSSLIAAVGSLLCCLLASPSFRIDVLVWLWLVTTLASWALTLPVKFAEGRVEDHAPLRFTQLVTGAMVGCAAWGLSTLLMLEVTYLRDMVCQPRDALFSQMFGGHTVEATYINGGWMTLHAMPLPMYAAWFAFLFVMLRWWKQAEYARRVRVSLWSVAWCAAISWVMSFFWWFPQPLGMCVAAVTALSIQLSSAWLPPSRRRRLAEEYV
ncbi:MAG: hypothetical protein KDA61_22990, partial [Planctomycetales bacterium]|nr:hypothetical protein [Planctomycetales bacterium]